MTRRFPAVPGVLLALVASALFGASTPFVQRAGTGVGAFTTAALLYAGAALAGWLLRQPVEREAALRRADFRVLALMAFLGALAGPVALAWGLQHTSGTSASLMLALEAVFTALSARALFGEHLGRRVMFALALLLAGGVVLIADSGYSSDGRIAGLVAVLGATVAWGVDNTLSRALADRDPGQVVLAKALMGVAGALSLALLRHEPVPRVPAAATLLLIGVLGYGLSLRFYLLAQRAFGAARTGSVFAFAPFIGAAVAIALGDRSVDAGMVVGGAFILAGVVVHLAEDHAHAHVHEPQEHEHAHTHDDGHHEHVHVPMPDGAHSHRHRHDSVEHDHQHVPDTHHVHVHR